MRRNKRIIPLLLALAVALTSLSFTGCGSVEKEQEPIPLTVYSQLANTSGDQIGWFAKVLLDRFNVKVNIVNDADGIFVTRMESGDLGDIIIFGTDSRDYQEAIKNGMLFDWNEDDLLSENGPYIKEHMPKALEKNISINPDGKLYGYGFDVASTPDDHASTIYHPDVRFDLYQELGYPEVSTLEDWITILAQMKEICPTSDSGNETYGVSLFNDWDGNMVMFVKSTAALYGYEEFGIGLYDVENQTWQDCLAEGGQYLRSLKFHNQLFQRGLLDPDSMTQGADGAGEDYMGGVAFFNIFNYAGAIQYNTPEHLAAGKAMYPVIMEDQKTLTSGLNVFGGSRVITIGAKSQYPELCMEIINWLSTPEGKMVTTYGPQGVTWDYDENKKTYLTELGLQTVADGNTKLTGEYSGIFKDGVNGMNFSTWIIDATNPDSNGETYNYKAWASYNATLNDDILNDWRKFSGFTTQDEYINANNLVVAVGTNYSETQRDDELELKWQQVSNTICDYSWRAIYAETDEEYEKLVKEMKEVAFGYGYEEVADFYRNEATIRKTAEDAVKN